MPSSRATILGLIDSAQKTLDIYAEVITDKQFVAAVKSAIDRGVRVRIVMTESYGQDLLDEPVLSSGEKPIETYFPRILKRELSDEDKTLDLDSFMEVILPICLFDPEAAHLYRNRKELYRILAGHVPGIKEGMNGGKHER